ncbi:helix-turn-helix protein [Nonlabens dokdonensis]|jgi:predicted DNA-binding transcriptional regulator AlpA|uniref:Helix-turn-helix domain-containing protein n=2 Tax=Nonlabens dokdonensis TaxID=328515 RepID=L7W624_NONDD|nr:helix-turn-helix domain-containing protein [Nonlabens dokdonensis]AGC77130.1 hypothetical protein DDD_2003 [Nonlabens dokdonensis DSW-6]PZX41088.1 helix-turn-helix protein [Nonlabens dokdonensis]
MSEIAISRQGTQNAINLVIDSMAQLFSERVSEKLKETGFFPVQEIEVKAESDPNEDELLKVQDVMDILKVKKGAIYDWRKKGILVPDSYVGRSPRYKRSTINDYVNTKTPMI